MKIHLKMTMTLFVEFDDIIGRKQHTIIDKSSRCNQILDGCQHLVLICMQYVAWIQITLSESQLEYNWNKSFLNCPSVVWMVVDDGGDDGGGDDGGDDGGDGGGEYGSDDGGDDGANTW